MRAPQKSPTNPVYMWGCQVEEITAMFTPSKKRSLSGQALPKEKRDFALHMLADMQRAIAMISYANLKNAETLKAASDHSQEKIDTLKSKSLSATEIKKEFEIINQSLDKDIQSAIKIFEAEIAEPTKLLKASTEKLVAALPTLESSPNVKER